MLFVKNKFQFLKNIFLVIFNKYSWVGYSKNNLILTINLPKIKKGILNPLDNFEKKNISDKTRKRINIVYAKNYKITNDLYIIFKSINKLGRKIS